jgi:hypothetical protein
VEKRHGSTSLPPVRVSGHLLGTGGLIHDTSHGSEGEVWRVGPDRWGHHRHDHRLCMGGVDHLGHDQKDGRRGGLGGAGGDLRRPILKQPNAQEQLQALEKVDNYKRHTFIEQGGWDKMPGEAQAGSTVARACVEGLEVLMKK